MFIGDLGVGEVGDLKGEFVIGLLLPGEPTKETLSSLSRDAPVGVGGDDGAGGKALR